MCNKQQTVDFCKCIFSSSIQFESGFIVSTYCSMFSHCDRYFILQSDWLKKNTYGLSGFYGENFENNTTVSTTNHSFSRKIRFVTI